MTNPRLDADAGTGPLHVALEDLCATLLAGPHRQAREDVDRLREIAAAMPRGPDGGAERVALAVDTLARLLESHAAKEEHILFPAVRALAESGPARADWDGIGTVEHDPGAIDRHLDAVLALPEIDLPQIRAAGFHVALDCVRGAGGTTMPRLLERLGCQVSAIHLEVDGRFPREPEPIPEHLGELGVG